MLNKIKEVWKEHQTMIIIALGVFISGILAGLVMPADAKAIVLEGMMKKISDIWIANTFILALRIFMNNMTAAALMVFTGVIITVIPYLIIRWIEKGKTNKFTIILRTFFLGFAIIIPILIIYINGMIISIVLSVAATERNMTFLTMMASMLPHGIFEIPALLFTAGMGMTLGIKLFFDKWFMKEKSIKQVFQKTIKQFFTVILILFLIAAFVESFITPTVAGIADESLSCNIECRDLDYNGGSCNSLCINTTEIESENCFASSCVCREKCCCAD